MLPGVYSAKKKNGEIYYRSSITFLNKHISLGSYSTEEDAHSAYLLAKKICSQPKNWTIENYSEYDLILPFEKYIILVNYRDHKIYFKTPIYIRKHYFYYYMTPDLYFKFDVDDLFYYANHKIVKRGGHLFVTEYGMQVNILSRYGIKNYAVPGRDYCFVNGDPTDYRYGNIKIIHRYFGVTSSIVNGSYRYHAKVNINGYYNIGSYSTEVEAAIAYNKVIQILKDRGFRKNFPENYIDEVDEITYAALYQRIRISKNLSTFIKTYPKLSNKY